MKIPVQTKEIFIILQGDRRVIYFHGWDGFGASVVLRSIAERAIAEELELESSIMAILDNQDEQDDFDGSDERSRNEITSVSREINNILKNSRFVLIFHNGSDNEIVDLFNFGVPPITSFGDNVMIWAYRRRMLTIKKYEEDELLHELRYTHLFIYDRMGFLADIIVARNPCIQGVNQLMVVHCCLYKLFLQCSVSKNNSNWVDVASNYWICDGILEKDITLETSAALHREITWKCDDNVLTKFKAHFKLSFLIVKEDDVYEDGSYRWISVTSRDREMLGMKTLPAETSSFFLEFVMSDQQTMLPNGLLEHSSNLVLHHLLFLKCHNLRFIGLDHCTDDKTGEGEDHTEWVCLHSLWVLDLCYTHWNEILSPAKMDLMHNLMELSIEGVLCWQYTTCLQGRLRNLHRLRIIKPTHGPDISTDASNSFMDKIKLEILDLSGNNEMEILPNNLSKASGLQVLILDGCNRVVLVPPKAYCLTVPDGLPQLLKSFSFDGYGPAFHRAIAELPPKQERPSTPAAKEGASISNISLKGCSKLANMFLRGLPKLVELDLSGTAIRTLDFSTMVVEVPMLKRLFMLGCEHLRAIIWGNITDSFKLELLCIDTRAGTGSARPCIDRNNFYQLEVYVILVDKRLARSLWKLLYNHYAAENVYLNIHVTSAVYSGPIQSKVTYKEKKIGMYGDQVSLPQLVQADRYNYVQSMVGDALVQDFPKPPTNNLDRHIEITEGWHVMDSGLGDVMKGFAESLHAHDVSTSASLPTGLWRLLRQCRVERCPKLDNHPPARPASAAADLRGGDGGTKAQYHQDQRMLGPAPAAGGGCPQRRHEEADRRD
ncbi:hypothetical protein VPH35_126046 [Triticum aestivum]